MKIASCFFKVLNNDIPSTLKDYYCEDQQPIIFVVKIF